MLRIPILASEINNLTDARYFAAREATWLSFSLNQTSVQQIAAIQEWVDGVTIVPAFETESVDNIIEQATFLNASTIQLSPFYNMDSHAQLAHFDIIQLVLLEETTDWNNLAILIHQLSSTATFLLIDGYKANINWQELTTGQRQQLQNWCSKYPIILGLPFSSDAIDDVLQLEAKAINLRGSEEEKVGFKSFEEVDEILDALDIED
jgi:phosphoribosylanthranilate isomerase